MILKNEPVAPPTSTGTHGVRTWTWTLESCCSLLCTLENHGSTFPEGVLVNGSKPIQSTKQSLEIDMSSCFFVKHARYYYEVPKATIVMRRCSPKFLPKTWVQRFIKHTSHSGLSKQVYHRNFPSVVMRFILSTTCQVHSKDKMRGS
jgi:hypothetical protein